MLSKEKGDFAVANAIHYFMTNGFEVCLPVGDKRPYDIVVEIDNKLYRVQVKFAGYYTRAKQHKAALRITGGNRSSNTAKMYTDTDFDTLFIYTASGRKFVIPWTEVKSRNEINIEHAKYSMYEVT